MGKSLNAAKSPDKTRRGIIDGLMMDGLAPRLDWSGMSDTDHFVQFYETDSFLLSSLSGFVDMGLSAGDACIVVATNTHRKSLGERLKASGADLAAAGARGQYLLLDAEETLSKFMRAGAPEPERFANLLGGIISRAGEGHRRVRIFGEMVALLWEKGNHSAAIRLEELWNELLQDHPSMLFCAYPLEAVGGESLAEPLTRVCAGHSRVIPAESYISIDDAGERLRAIAILQQKAKSLEAEVAERKKAEAALRAVKSELEVQLKREQEARAEAESANRLKDEFLATVSHELRTPLNAIMGWSHLLRCGRLDESSAERAIETIERNAKSQAQLIEDILDMSRVITGKLRLNIGPVDMASVINAAIDSIQLAADSKGIRLEVTIDPSARRVSGDSSRLQQVIWNLLSNAIKFTPRAGRVEVRLERAEAAAQVTVSDSGLGIDKDFLPFIFDRFRQADGSITRRHGGLGLGLAIVRHLVELHGGTVHAHSAGEGRGSTFRIRLPLASERGRSLKEEIVSLELLSGRSISAEPFSLLEGVQVLLVDDDQDTLQVLAALLAEYGAEVRAASSAAEALALLQSCDPDVLVSDLAMPDEDGYSLISKVRAMGATSGKQIPAVALTAYVRAEDRSRASLAGFNLIVPKPVEPGELVKAIERLARIDPTKFERGHKH